MIEDFPKIEEDEERDCPICQGSGPCYMCKRGRDVTEEFRAKQEQVMASRGKQSYLKSHQNKKSA